MEIRSDQKTVNLYACFKIDVIVWKFVWADEGPFSVEGFKIDVIVWK